MITKNPIQTLYELKQSVWYDNINRGLLENGEIARMINDGDIQGITSNPTIFEKAIAKSNNYDSALGPMIKSTVHRKISSIRWRWKISRMLPICFYHYIKRQIAMMVMSAWRLVLI